MRCRDDDCAKTHWDKAGEIAGKITTSIPILHLFGVGRKIYYIKRCREGLCNLLLSLTCSNGFWYYRIDIYTCMIHIISESQ